MSLHTSAADALGFVVRPDSRIGPETYPEAVMTSGDSLVSKAIQGYHGIRQKDRLQAAVRSSSVATAIEDQVNKRNIREAVDSAFAETAKCLTETGRPHGSRPHGSLSESLEVWSAAGSVKYKWKVGGVSGETGLIRLLGMRGHPVSEGASTEGSTPHTKSTPTVNQKLGEHIANYALREYDSTKNASVVAQGRIGIPTASIRKPTIRGDWFNKIDIRKQTRNGLLDSLDQLPASARVTGVSTGCRVEPSNQAMRADWDLQFSVGSERGSIRGSTQPIHLKEMWSPPGRKRGFSCRGERSQGARRADVRSRSI